MQIIDTIERINGIGQSYTARVILDTATIHQIEGMASEQPGVEIVCGNVMVRAIMPQNRFAARRRHLRLQHSVDGKQVARDAAAAALD